MKTILLQGDSITDAGRSRENDTYYGVGYPNLIAGELGYQCPGEYKFLNRGIGGNRIVDLYARIKCDFINLKPDVLSILIGINDVWHEIGNQNGVDAEKFYKVYCMLIEEIKEALPEIQIMIMEPFVLKGPATEAAWEEFRSETEKRAEKAKAVAEKYNLVYIPLQEKFDQAAKICPPTYWLSDGVHPTVAGHELLTRAWMEGFEKLEK